MKTNFKVTTVSGIPIEINVTWLIIFGLVVVTLSQGYYPTVAPEFSAPVHWLMAVISSLLLFLCLLLHELSHSLVAKANKLPIAGITLFVFGGVAHMEKEPQSPKVEFLMAAAGPLMSIFLASIFLLLRIFAESARLNSVFIVTADYLFIINLAVAIFNLVPGFPLDGGRLLRAGIWYYLGDLKKATQIAAGFGKGFAVMLMALGFISLIFGNFISGIWFIFLGIFLQEAAEMGYRQVVMKKVFAHNRVKDLMSENLISIPADLTLEDVIYEYYFKYRHHIFPVIENDKIIGLITFHDIKEIPKIKWKDVTAREVAIPIQKNFLVHSDTNLNEALSLMAENGIGRVMVIENQKFIGILSQKDIIRLFKLKSDLE